MQKAYHLIGTYQPYLQYMAAYIRRYAPKAKLYLQETWAYEEGCRRLCEKLKYNITEDLLADIRTAYHKATEEIQADSIIPSGDVIFIKGEIDEYTGNRKIFSCPICL